MQGNVYRGFGGGVLRGYVVNVIEYVVNSSGSLSRDVKPVEGTVFCSPKEGFSLITVDEDSLNLHMMDKKGRILHTVTCTK